MYMMHFWEQARKRRYCKQKSRKAKAGIELWARDGEITCEQPDLDVWKKIETAAFLGDRITSPKYGSDGSIVEENKHLDRRTERRTYVTVQTNVYDSAVFAQMLIYYKWQCRRKKLMCITRFHMSHSEEGYRIQHLRLEEIAGQGRNWSNRLGTLVTRVGGSFFGLN